MIVLATALIVEHWCMLQIIKDRHMTSNIRIGRPFVPFALMLLSAVLLFCRCSGEEGYNEPKFKKVIHPEFEVLGEELLYSPYRIVAGDGRIIVTGSDPASGATCFVYDGSGALLGSGVMTGRGPAETLTGYMFPVCYGDAVTYYDIYAKEKLSFGVSDLLQSGSSSVSKTDVDLPSWTVAFTGTPDGREVIVRNFAGNVANGKPVRSVELMADGESVASWDEAAFDDPAMVLVSTLQSQMAISPDGRKMVICPTPGATMELFSLEDGLDRRAVKRYIEPKIIVRGASYERQNDYVFGIERVSATDKTIYVVYDGETTWAEARDDEDLLIYRNIASFDWNGNPLVLYKTDYRVRSVCELSDYLYAIVEDASGRCFLARTKR